MKSFFKNILSVLALSPFLFALFLVSPKETLAACVINDVNINPNGVQPTQIGDSDPITPDDFPGPENPYRDSNANGSGYVEEGYTEINGANGTHSPPYVYIDVQTSGCDGTTFSLDIADRQWADEIAQFQAASPTFLMAGGVGWVAYLIAQAIPAQTAADAIAAHVVINVGPSSPASPPSHHTDSDNFTIALRAGEKNCVQSPGEYDCKYIFVLSAPGVQAHAMGSFALPELMYDCDGTACTDPWQWGGLNTYQGRNDAPTASVNYVGTNSYFTEGYDQLLAPLPGFSENSSPNIGEFLRALFTVLIMIAGILAFIMLVIGGITYATADAIEGSTSGREMMWNAVLGLIIALGAWVILNTINPNLASNLSITIPKATFDDVSPEWQNGNASIGTVITHASNTLNGQAITQGAPWPSDATQRGQLAAAGITVNTSNNCPTAGTAGCTSLYFEGAAASVINQLIAFKALCACDMVVTGGSEAWLHSSHGPTRKIIDLRATDGPSGLNTYLRGLPGGPIPGESFPTGKSITVAGFGKFYAEPPGSTGNTTAQHWHVTFN